MAAPQDICFAPDPGALEVLDALRAAGYRAYFVGGCVRDSLAGRTPADWDICTAARPGQVLDLFGAQRCIPTGLQHGTVTVRAAGGLYEVTTFRVEGGYADGRHPDHVDFVDDLQADLARRDFTINAMAWAPGEGLADPFGGQADLLVHRVVRAVGDPARRFAEDGLRILRLYRFGAREQLSLDPATARAAIDGRARLGCVSAERIWQELAKLLSAPRPAGWMPAEIMDVLLPGLGAAADPAGYAACLRAVDALPPDPLARLAALLCLRGAGFAGRSLAALRCSNAEAKQVQTLVEYGALAPDGTVPPRRQARRLLARLGPDTLLRLLALRRAQTGDAAFDELAAAARALLAENACCGLGQLAVTGRDLLALGVKPGPAVGRLLAAALEQVVEERLPNRRDALLGWLQTHLNTQEEP